VKTLVVPEGGELPPEEELAALEAAEAAAEVEAAEAAEVEHSQAETAIAEVLAEDEEGEAGDDVELPVESDGTEPTDDPDAHEDEPPTAA
jgi:hypothetical protein